MAMTSLSIVLTVFVLQLHYVGPNQKPAPRWLRRLVIGGFARMLCLRSRLGHFKYYNHRNDRPEEMRLTSFVDTTDNKDSNNCNGRLGQNSVRPSSHDQRERDRDMNGGKYEKISSHFKMLMTQNESDDSFQEIIDEWRLIAHIMDRLLFWLFFVASVLSTLTILVFQPMMKPE